MEFRFKTPKWFDTIWMTIKYAVSSTKWIFNPPRCTECGKRLHCSIMQFRTPNLSISNHGDLICAECISTEVDTCESGNLCNTKPEPEVKSKCDCCGKKVRSYRFFTTNKIRLHFCMSWWNGFYICKSCIRQTLKDGIPYTSFLKYDSYYKKMWYIDRSGLYLDDSGKVILFKIDR